LKHIDLHCDTFAAMSKQSTVHLLKFRRVAGFVTDEIP
jgi:hypothetical protein